MSGLQVGLIVAGALVLAGIVVYNAWVARVRLPRPPQQAGGRVGHEAVDPTLGGELGIAPDTESTDPVLDFQGTAVPRPASTAAAYLPLDGLIDAIAAIALDGGSVRGDTLLAHLPATRRIGGKPFSVEARPQDGGDWEFPLAGKAYAAVQAGIQLANRSGPLTQIEFSEFVAKAQRFADAIGAAADFPDMAHEVERGQELDQFAGQYDVRLAFSIQAQSAAWSVGFIEQQAQRLGFVRASFPGRMVLPADEAGQPPILELGLELQQGADEAMEQAVVQQVTLGFDVPGVPVQAQPFPRLCQLSHELAQVMDGVVTDERGAPLQQQTLEHIGEQLHQVYAILEQRGLPAGARETRRLFS